MRVLTLTAYAKLNLGLRVMGTRLDAYHEIESTLQTIDLADRLTLRQTEALDVQLEIFPDSGHAPEDDLVHRAASLILARADHPSGVAIRLEKRIPIGAGLGGGSSDAAATLVGLNRLWSLELPMSDLWELALQLGSDVPFFLRGGRCRVGGRGERIEPVKASRDETFVLLIPPWSLSTGAVYREYDQRSPSSPLDSPYPNDLEAAALQLAPQLRIYREWLMSQEVLFGLSGSGAVYYAVTTSLDRANELVDAARQDLSGTFAVCRPTAHGHRFC